MTKEDISVMEELYSLRAHKHIYEKTHTQAVAAVKAEIAKLLEHLPPEKFVTVISIKAILSDYLKS